MAYIGSHPWLEGQKEMQYARLKLAGTGAKEGDVIPYIMQRRPQWRMYAASVNKPYVDWLYDKVARRSGASQGWEAKHGKSSKNGKNGKNGKGSKAAKGIGKFAGEAIGSAFSSAAGELAPDPWYLKAGAVGLVAMVVVGGGVLYYVTRPPK